MRMHAEALLSARIEAQSASRARAATRAPSEGLEDERAAAGTPDEVALGGRGATAGARAARASLVGGAVVPWRGAAADCIWPILNISAGYRGETQAARRRELTG